MEPDQGKPDNSNFGVVVLLAAIAILVIIAATAVIVRWRARQNLHPPYTRHPQSRFYAPERPGTPRRSDGRTAA